MLGVFTKKPVGEQVCFVPIIAVLNEGVSPREGQLFSFAHHDLSLNPTLSYPSLLRTVHL